MKHANISIFVPHVGCRHRCSFCDQNAITGMHSLPSERDVDKAVERAGAIMPDTEIAFFGGSFTAIDRNYMLMLLKSAYKYVKSGKVRGIRVSTRPDAIDDEILSILRDYGVTSIELGAQSMNEMVLEANRRGHTPEDVKKASRLIASAGFELGMQMMTGLYMSDDEKDIETAWSLCRLRPATVRIYPTIVFKNTYLGRLFKEGEYMPQTLEAAVNLCVKLIDIFEKNDIKVIRTGLHTIDEDDYLSGPWHPAFRELCDNLRYYNSALEKIERSGGHSGRYVIYTAKGCMSKMTGQHRCNILKLKNMGYDCRVEEADKLHGGEIEVLTLK